MKTEAIPRVGVVDALSTGLVEVAHKPWLITIPLISELLLWLAPPISVGNLLERFMRVWEALLRATYTPAQMATMKDLLTSMRDMAATLGSSSNLLEGIAGGWLGAPSIITNAQVTRMTFITDLVLAPAGLALQLPHLVPAPWRGAPLQVANVGMLLLALVGFWLIGQVLAAAYLRWVANAWHEERPVYSVARSRVTASGSAAVLSGGVPAPKPAAASAWGGPAGLARLTVRLALYSILVGVIVTVLRLPLAFALSLLWLSSSSALGLLLLLLGGVALWMTLWFLVSLFFVNEAILLDQQPIVRGILHSLVLVHNNFWPTMALGLLVNLLMYGFQAVWGMLGANPAGAAVAIVMNAYLATSMLIAIFVFYENLTRRGIAPRVVGSKT